MIGCLVLVEVICGLILSAKRNVYGKNRNIWGFTRIPFSPPKAKNNKDPI